MPRDGLLVPVRQVRAPAGLEGRRQGLHVEAVGEAVDGDAAAEVGLLRRGEDGGRSARQERRGEGDGGAGGRRGRGPVERGDDEGRGLEVGLGRQQGIEGLGERDEASFFPRGDRGLVCCFEFFGGRERERET